MKYDSELHSQKEIEAHPCSRCIWARWAGTKFVCMFSKCACANKKKVVKPSKQ
jgi:hypothetical protein